VRKINKLSLGSHSKLIGFPFKLNFALSISSGASMPTNLLVKNLDFYILISNQFENSLFRLGGFDLDIELLIAIAWRLNGGGLFEFDL
jgi:hypothetical protein